MSTNPSPETPYIPSKEQIRQACEEIQSEWSEAERYRRAGGKEQYHVPSAKDHGRGHKRHSRRLYG